MTGRARRAGLGLALAAGLAAVGRADEPAAAGKRPPVLVGAVYARGWAREGPGGYGTGAGDWRRRFPERLGLLGMFTDQETVNAELQAAADHGVDFFVVPFYPPAGDRDAAAQALNRPLDLIMASVYNRRTPFAIEDMNEGPFAGGTETAWLAVCKQMAGIMRDPGYLRVGGRPVVWIHDLAGFVGQCHNDLDLVRQRLEVLRASAKAARVGDIVIGGGADPVPAAAGPARAPFALVDFASLIRNPGELPGAAAGGGSWDVLLAAAAAGLRTYEDGFPVPFLPGLPVGFDPRPLGDGRPAFTAPTSDQWRSACERMLGTLSRTARLGIPLPGGGVQPAFVIHAWNDFGEGAALAPTVGNGAGYLESLAQARRAVPH